MPSDLADQTLDTGDGVAIAGDFVREGNRALIAELRQSLTEAEASHQAEIGRLQYRLDHAQVERDQALGERDTLTARLAEAEKVVEAAVQWRNEIIRGATAWTFDEINLEADLENKLISAVDAYRASRAETTNG